MRERLLFEETQKFGSPSLYASMGAIYLGVMGLFGYGLYQQLVLGQPFGNKPMSDIGLWVTTLLVLLVLVVSGWLLFGSKLQVTITHVGIDFRFWPYTKGVKRINIEDIARFQIRKYKPILEYGGWGVKKGIKNRGMAYNVRGKVGLQLELKNGKRILFGTQRAEAMQRAMQKMMEL